VPSKGKLLFEEELIKHIENVSFSIFNLGLGQGGRQKTLAVFL